MTVPRPPPGYASRLRQGTPGRLPERLERRFNRHFAERQLTTDVFGTCVGACVYLSLLPSLTRLQRPDLCFCAVVCSLLCLWPPLLSRVAKAAYLQYRDYILQIHFLFHYGVGGQMARYVRLHNKLQIDSPAAFLAGFLLSSTVLWQAVDALMYRQRYRYFILFKPILLMEVLPLEWALCKQTCEAMPDDAQYFGQAASLVRLLLAVFRPLPQPLGDQDYAENPQAHVRDCFKVQTFLLTMLAWVLPAIILGTLEKQALEKFMQTEAAAARASAAGIAMTAEASTGPAQGGMAAPAADADADADAAATAAATGHPGDWAAAAEGSRLLQQQQQDHQQGEGPQADHRLPLVFTAPAALMLPATAIFATGAIAAVCAALVAAGVVLGCRSGWQLGRASRSGGSNSSSSSDVAAAVGSHPEPGVIEAVLHWSNSSNRGSGVRAGWGWLSAAADNAAQLLGLAEEYVLGQPPLLLADPAAAAAAGQQAQQKSWLVRWGVPFLVAGLCWHTLDTLL